MERVHVILVVSGPSRQKFRRKKFRGWPEIKFPTGTKFPERRKLDLKSEVRSKMMTKRQYIAIGVVFSGAHQSLLVPPCRHRTKATGRSHPDTPGLSAGWGELRVSRGGGCDVPRTECYAQGGGREGLFSAVALGAGRALVAWVARLLVGARAR